LQETQQLISCFFKSCENALDFLQDNHGFQYISGMVEYKQGRKLIRPFRGDSIPENFWALSRYEKQDIAIEISYHEEEHIIESHIYFGFVDRYNLSDLAHAAKKADKRLNTQYGVANQPFLSQTIEDIGASMRTHAKLMTSCNERLLKRSNTIRNKRIENSVRDHYNRNKKQATEKAAKAFMEKDYRRVIELYHPYKSDLKATDLKKYRRAIDTFKKNAQTS
jgi:hypothetical protein